MKQTILIALLLCVTGFAQADSSFSNCSSRTTSLVKDAVNFSIVNFNKIKDFANTEKDIGKRPLSKIKKALNTVNFTCVKSSSSKCKRGAMSYTGRKSIYLCENNINRNEYDRVCALSGMIMYDLAHMNGVRKHPLYHNSSDEHKRRKDKAYPLEYASMITCYEHFDLM